MSTDSVQSPTYSPLMWVLFAKSIQTNLPAGLAQSKEEDEAPVSIFLWKERNSKVVHRVHVKSQPLNVVYNPIVIKFVTEFLTILDDVNTASYCQIKSKLKLLHSAMYDTYNVDLNNIVKNVNINMIQLMKVQMNRGV